MAWTIRWRDSARKDLESLDHGVQRRIVSYLRGRIATEEDPRRFGKALGNRLAGLWRYRVGDHRVICRIEDDRLVVLIVAVAHRKHVYVRALR